MAEILIYIVTIKEEAKGEKQAHLSKSKSYTFFRVDTDLPWQSVVSVYCRPG